MSDETTTYPGRDTLNTANARARRAFAAVNREARHYDPDLLPQLEALVLEAAETLGRIAVDAEELEQSSARRQRELKEQRDRVRALTKKAQRRGTARAADVLQRLDAFLGESQAPRHADDRG
ncbi:hypothetical protein ABTX35_11955 [Streptomyces sp. NPDC096080]|uniref:hypothetical protein n=1 Tax=Streptomyces sp. NPDC096080 TaxID=3156693 RepID=UPI00332BF23F